MCSDDCDLTLSLNMMKRKSEGLQSARISKILFKELSDNYKYFLPGLGRDKVLFELWAEKFCPGPTHTFPSFRFYVWTNTLNTTINLQWEKPMESKYHRQLDRTLPRAVLPSHCSYFMLVSPTMGGRTLNHKKSVVPRYKKSSNLCLIFIYLIFTFLLLFYIFWSISL